MSKKTRERNGKEKRRRKEKRKIKVNFNKNINININIKLRKKNTFFKLHRVSYLDSMRSIKSREKERESIL